MTAPAPRRRPPRAWAAWVASLLLVSQPCRRRRPRSARGPATWARRARCRPGCRRRRRNPRVLVVAPSMLLHSFQSFQRWRRARAIRSSWLQLCVWAVGCTHPDRSLEIRAGQATSSRLPSSSIGQTAAFAHAGDTPKPGKLKAQQLVCSQRYTRHRGEALAKESATGRGQPQETLRRSAAALQPSPWSST